MVFSESFAYDMVQKAIKAGLGDTSDWIRFKHWDNIYRNFPYYVEVYVGTIRTTPPAFLMDIRINAETLETSRFIDGNWVVVDLMQTSSISGENITDAVGIYNLGNPLP